MKDVIPSQEKLQPYSSGHGANRWWMGLAFTVNLTHLSSLLSLELNIYNVSKVVHVWIEPLSIWNESVGKFSKDNKMIKRKCGMKRVNGTITRSGCSFSVAAHFSLWCCFCFCCSPVRKGRLCRSASVAVKFSQKTQVYCRPHFTSCVVKRSQQTRRTFQRE